MTADAARLRARAQRAWDARSLRVEPYSPEGQRAAALLDELEARIRKALADLEAESAAIEAAIAEMRAAERHHGLRVIEGGRR